MVKSYNVSEEYNNTEFCEVKCVSSYETVTETITAFKKYVYAVEKDDNVNNPFQPQPRLTYSSKKDSLKTKLHLFEIFTTSFW